MQTFVVSAGATRLFLGTTDGVGWSNNGGSFTATVTAGAASANIPTLSLPMLVVLSLALAGVATILIRRD